MKKPVPFKKIYQYTVSGIFVKEHENVMAVAEELGVGIGAIYQVLSTAVKTRTCKGFQFSYEKHERIRASKGRSGTMISVEELDKKINREINPVDMGIVDNPYDRDYGKRKIKIKEGLYIYAHKNKSMAEIKTKYQNI